MINKNHKKKLGNHPISFSPSNNSIDNQQVKHKDVQLVAMVIKNIERTCFAILSHAIKTSTKSNKRKIRMARIAD
jgi:hypothetical protein